MKGEVIGINTVTLGNGTSFSISANDAQVVIDQLINYSEVKRGWLGVRIKDVTQDIARIYKLNKLRGALVTMTKKNSPALRAKIKADDIILEFNRQKINKMEDLPKIVAKTEVGKLVEVKIWRDNKEATKYIVIGEFKTYPYKYNYIFLFFNQIEKWI